MTNITASQIIEQVTALVQERPDFIYTEQKTQEPSNGCGYAGASMGSTEGEACIVGQALSRLGLSQHELLALDDVGGAILVLEFLDIPATKQEEEFLFNIQFSQDYGESWQDSYNYADTYRRNRKRT